MDLVRERMARLARVMSHARNIELQFKAAMLKDHLYQFLDIWQSLNHALKCDAPAPLPPVFTGPFAALLTPFLQDSQAYFREIGATAPRTPSSVSGEMALGVAAPQKKAAHYLEPEEKMAHYLTAAQVHAPMYRGQVGGPMYHGPIAGEGAPPACVATPTYLDSLKVGDVFLMMDNPAKDGDMLYYKAVVFEHTDKVFCFKYTSRLESAVEKIELPLPAEIKDWLAPARLEPDRKADRSRQGDMAKTSRLYLREWDEKEPDAYHLSLEGNSSSRPFTATGTESLVLVRYLEKHSKEMLAVLRQIRELDDRTDEEFFAAVKKLT